MEASLGHPYTMCQLTPVLVWTLITCYIPQARRAVHPPVRTAEADSRREREMLLSYRVKANDSIKRKADFIPCMSQNSDVNTALHVCSYLTLRLRSKLFLVTQQGLKTQHSTSLTHCSPPHIITGSESYLWCSSVLPGVPDLCPISQHPVTHWYCQALVDVTSLAYIPERKGLNITTGNDQHTGNMVKGQQDQEILQKTASPKQNAVRQFYVRVQPKPWEGLSLIYLPYVAPHVALMGSSSKMRMSLLTQ